jgi:hypothetical protein
MHPHLANIATHAFTLLHLQFVMLASVLSAKSVDEWVARAQRQQLGLCERCGGLYDPATCTEGQCPLKAGSRTSN